MKALILAAGEGTRLKQLTHHRPKPMLPLRNIPLLQYTIEWLREHGIYEIAINLHHYPEVITDYFGDGGNFGVSIIYSYEETLRGTAGAAKQLEYFLDETFVTVYGDVYTNLDLGRICLAHEWHNLATANADSSIACMLTMALYNVTNPEECGLVMTNEYGRVTRFVEKPPPHEVFTNRAFSGVMVCEPEILEYIPAESTYDFGKDLVPKLLWSGQPIYGEPLVENEFVIDIGTLSGYLRALQTATTQPVWLQHAIH